MVKNFLLNLDLITKREFHEEEIEKLKGKILSVPGDSLSSFISESLGFTKDRRIEIYLENVPLNLDDSEFFSILKKVESVMEGFISGSSAEWIQEYPSLTKRWVKTDYSWELEESEEEESWEDDAYWEEGWEEWNDEWN
jgi:hypothetical protein